MTPRRELPGPPSSGPSGYLITAALMVVVCPSALLAWAWATWARRDGHRYAPLVLAVATGGCAVLLRGVLAGVYGDLAGGYLAAAQRGSWGILGAVAVVFCKHLALTVPVGMPVGLVAGTLTARTGRPVPAAPQAAPKQVERPNVQRSTYLARALDSSPPGDLEPQWYHRGYLVMPEREAGLSRLVLGRPGRGKSVYLQREAYLIGRLGRRLTVIDCKGERGFAEAIVAAYLAGWADGGHSVGGARPTMHLWPAQPLNAWTGGPVAVANRLLSCWAWNPRNEWHREPVAMALRLGLTAPGPPVASSKDLLYRMQPGVLARLWEEHPDESALVRSLSQDHRLDDVCIRLGNLMASLGGLLDGTEALGTADLTVMSLPVAAAEHDAASILRVAMADLAHHVTVRKDPDAAEQIIVDEFSAVPGGRDHAIHLVERGRSAQVAVVLAVQSNRGLGDDQEADRIIGAAGTYVVFAIAEPERVIGWAGTRRQVEQTSTSSGDDGVTRYTSTRVWVDQVDPNVVRALPPGQAFILSGGRAQLCQVIRPPSLSAEDGPPHAASTLSLPLDRLRRQGVDPSRGPRPLPASQEGRGTPGSDNQQEEP